MIKCKISMMSVERKRDPTINNWKCKLSNKERKKSPEHGEGYFLLLLIARALKAAPFYARLLLPGIFAFKINICFMEINHSSYRF